MASWNSLPFEVKSQILEHFIRYSFATATPRLGASDWESSETSNGLVVQLPQLIDIVPEMRHEIIKHTRKIKTESDEIVKDEVKEHLAMVSGSLAFLYFQYVIESRRRKVLEALDIIQGRIELAVDRWDEASGRT